jgi:predicted ATP-grasp superfamily ATP-dependent carboligase
MKVLVTDGETRAALAITRSLGAQGHTVLISASERRSIAGSSRYCTAEHWQPPAADGPGALATAFADLMSRAEPDLVIGVTDRSLTVLHALPSDLIRRRLPPPDAGQYASASDKVALFALCRAEGIGAPGGVTVPGGGLPSPGELETLSRPLVVRPALSWRADDGRWIQGAVSYETDLDALAHRVETDQALRTPYLVQEKIRGEGCGLFLLAHEGRIVVAFSHRRLREKPPSGGVSTLCASTAVPGDLIEPTRRFAKALRWSGLAMLEFKRDERNGRPLLLEVNARPWGSLALAAAAGLDFPGDLVRLAQGQEPRSSEFREGVRLRWWWGDVDHFYLLEKEAGRSGSGAMMVALAKALAAGPVAEAWDTFRRDDPMPFLTETRTWAFG